MSYEVAWSTLRTTHVPPPVEELRFIDATLWQLDARRAQLLTRWAWLVGRTPLLPRPWPVPTPAVSGPQLPALSGAEHISGKPQARTTNPVRPDLARRASGAIRGAFRVGPHYRNAGVHRPHCDVRDRREQQFLQPGHTLFRGPELSAQPP
ncbi:hypothetical protein GCM10023336_21380 [Streptomyces similanensis]|uniref:Transposase n=1 Tax=Streptomyces similanensis TaxID=1274988 RepID=A0ABP9KA75_9ACTN